MRKVIIISAMYNVLPWVETTCMSIIKQHIPTGMDYQWVVVDDCSTDGTFERLKELVGDNRRVTILRNTERMGALYNWCQAIDISDCEKDDIIIQLDGDDWLSGRNVLATVVAAYEDDVWMTHGSYVEYPSMANGTFNIEYDDVVKSLGLYRTTGWAYSHLRSFKYGLFKHIDRQDFLVNSEYPKMTGDLFLYFPMLEMAAERVKFIDSKLYVYNLDTPLNDHKVDHNLQLSLERECRTMQPYKRLDTI